MTRSTSISVACAFAITRRPRCHRNLPEGYKFCPFDGAETVVEAMDPRAALGLASDPGIEGVATEVRAIQWKQPDAGPAARTCTGVCRLGGDGSVC